MRSILCLTVLAFTATNACAFEDHDRFAGHAGLLFVEKNGRHSRSVLDEVLHADVHGYGPETPSEPVGLDGQPFSQRQCETVPHHVDDDGITIRIIGNACMDAYDF